MANIEETIREMHVLFIEDDSDIRELVASQFAHKGFVNFHTAKAGWEGINHLEMNGADLVLLDLLLPDVEGVELLDKIVSGMEIPVICVTCKDDKLTQLEALEAGASDYVVKPFDSDILILKVDKILTTVHLQDRLERSRRRNQRLFLNVLQVMAKTLEAKDPYTRYHSENVARYARMIGRRMGLESDELTLLQIAGILHDFGKIGIKEGLLNKPGALTPEEYEVVKRHPLVATAILEPIDELGAVIDYIRHHHEFFDGDGYPAGLTGDTIPLGARILMVADAYDAMISERSYREPKTKAGAVKELKRCAGTQFDPQVVAAFLDALKNSDTPPEGA